MLSFVAALSILLVAAVCLGAWMRSLSRPLAEVLVDLLYGHAMRVAALAVACDKGLVAYRRELDAVRAGHRPLYTEAV